MYKEWRAAGWEGERVSSISLRLWFESCIQFIRSCEYLFDIKKISFQYAITILSSLSLERCLDNDRFGPFSAGRTYDWPVMHHSGTYIISLPPFLISSPSFPHTCFVDDNTYSAYGMIGWSRYMPEHSRLHNARFQPRRLLPGSS